MDAQERQAILALRELRAQLAQLGKRVVPGKRETPAERDIQGQQDRQVERVILGILGGQDTPD